jgi:DNA-binding response OmpR family regulator
MQVHRPHHILIVDDEELVASTLGLILQSQGYSVAVAFSGEQALKLAEERLPDMLISDVIMPGMDGFQLAIRLKELLPMCGVLLLSGNVATAERIELARRAGHHFEVLPKPVPPEEIIARVKDCLDPEQPAPGHALKYKTIDTTQLDKEL